MKLSTAIKRGGKLVKKQKKGRWVSYDKKAGGACGCAMGAAYLYLYPEELALVEKRKNSRGVNERAAAWANLNGQAKASSEVMFANDTLELTLDKIATGLVRRKFEVPDGKQGYISPKSSWLNPGINPEVEKIPLETLKEEVRRNS